MIKKHRRLLFAISISMFIHFFLYGGIYLASKSEIFKNSYEKSRMIVMKIKTNKPEPKPEPESKPKPEPEPEPEPRKKPISHKRTKKEKPSDENTDPVFGVTEKTVKKDEKKTGIGVRTGNTLMKEQEKKPPPEEVKDYKSGKKIRKTRKYNPVPPYKLGKMPRFKKRVTPEYPPALKEEGVEGKVIMKVGIDRSGKIKSIEILEADHPLFIKYAVAAMKKTEFFPAEFEDGNPADTKVEIPIKFELEL